MPARSYVVRAQTAYATPMSVPVSQFIGAVLFSYGSACFVVMAWVEDWVLPLRMGCAAWICGCTLYLWPPLRQELSKDGKHHASNFLQTAGMLSWAVGSAFAFDDDQIVAGLPATNAGYLAGSACLLFDALLQSRQFCLATLSSRNERISGIADVIAGFFYTLAGGFGGFSTKLELIQFGNCCWLVGSVISFVRPCLAFSEVKCVRRAAESTRKNDGVEVDTPKNAHTSSIDV